MRVGFGTPTSRKRVTAEERALILDLRAQGKTVREIEQLTGRSESTVKTTLRSAAC